MSEISNQFTQAVGNAIRALQFDDMTTQNLGTAKNHADYLEQIAYEIRTLSVPFDQEKLDALVARSEQLKESFQFHHRKKVLSTSMDEGDVELF